MCLYSLSLSLTRFDYSILITSSSLSLSLSLSLSRFDYSILITSSSLSSLSLSLFDYSILITSRPTGKTILVVTLSFLNKTLRSPDDCLDKSI
jgi:hypothetical protein